MVIYIKIICFSFGLITLDYKKKVFNLEKTNEYCNIKTFHDLKVFTNINMKVVCNPTTPFELEVQYLHALRKSFKVYS